MQYSSQSTPLETRFKPFPACSTALGEGFGLEGGLLVNGLFIALCLRLLSSRPWSSREARPFRGRQILGKVAHTGAQLIKTANLDHEFTDGGILRKGF